jgi:hypothetical protein
MSDKTPETLDRLWSNIPTGPAPIADILAAGHEARRRKRRSILAGVVAVTALVSGSGALAAHTLTGSDQSREETFVADGATRNLTVTVEIGVSAEVLALRYRNEYNAATWDPATQQLFFVSRFGYSSTCPPRGTLTEAQDKSLTLELTTPNTDGPCTADDNKVTATITGLTTPPEDLRVTENNRTWTVPVAEPFVPDGSESVGVPDLVGLDPVEARTALQQVGLVVKVEQRECGAAARCVPGVIETNPNAGSLVPSGSTVTLIVMRDDAPQPVLLTQPTSQIGRQALIAGPLTLLGDCIGIGEAVAIWPRGTTVLNAAPLTLQVPDLGTIQEGDKVTGAGGYFDAVTGNVEVDIPASCGTTQGVTFRVER